MSADKAYLSVENFEETAALGGQALIQFKVNSTGMAGGLFEKAFRSISLQRIPLTCNEFDAISGNALQSRVCCVLCVCVFASAMQSI